jgi:O-antigen chain-terminating methyltransferase
MLTDDFYRALEERFRGSRDVIKARQRVYMPIVEALNARTGKKVLDVGCGRAEWLELLTEHGIVAEGLDLNEEFVAGARAAGLSAIKADALEFLKAQPAGAYGLVSAFHVVEHLGFDNLLAFLKEAYRVVDEQGAVLLETPNPANLVVGACNFYIDPTHERPIPSVLLSFAAEYSGFESVAIVPVNRNFIQNDLELMPEQLPGASVINKVVAALDLNLMQAPDYAIVALKKRDAVLVEIAESLASASSLAVSAREEKDVDELIARIVKAEREAVDWREKSHQFEIRLKVAETRARAAHADVQRIELDMREARARVTAAEAEMREAQGRAATVELEATRLRHQVNELLGSRSWRITTPLRAASAVLKSAGISRSGAKRMTKLVLLHTAGYVRSRPFLKSKVSKVLSRFPGLRSRLVGSVGLDILHGVATESSARPVESFELLTARGRKVYGDLVKAKKTNTQ